MQDMITVRKQTAAEILNFPQSDFDKNGTHPAFGVMNLMQWINFFLLHEAHHMFAIFKLAAQLRNSQP